MSTFARLCRLLVFFSFAALAASAQQTLRVPQDFPTIQLALNAAQTGDTVSVGPGTWFENLALTSKEITLVSVAGPATTTLDGGHLGPVLQITHTPGMATVVSGFTIQNGSPSATSPSPTTAGILIANAGAQITNSTFQKNAGTNLGVLNGSVTLTSSSLSTASTAGGSCALSPSAGYLNPTTGVSLSGTSTVLIGSRYDSGSTAPSTAIGKPHPSTLRGNTIFGDGTPCSGVGIQAVTLGQPLLVLGNTIRNNAVGVTTDTAPILLIQNLIYDNVAGALHLIDRAASPNIDPATTQIVNNTIVNNLTSPVASADPASITDIFLDGTAAHIQFVNNILVGTTSHPVLTCASATPSLNDTPLLFAYNDLFNTTRAANSLAAGDCFPGLTNPLATNGNLTVDPQLTGSTDLHPLPASPVIDAGSNSAPGLIFLPFASNGSTLGLTPAGSASLEDAVASYGPDTITSGDFPDVGGTIRILDGSASGHNTIDMGAYEAPRAVNSTAGDPPSATLLTASAYLMPPGPVTFQALTGGFTRYGLGNPTTFFINGVPQASVSTESTPFATFSTTLSTPGLYAIVASAPTPELGYPASTSMPIYIRVTDSPTLATTTLTITASPTTQVLNQPVTLTIHLGSTTTSNGSTTTGPIPPGAVTLFEGATLLSSLQPDATGLATFTLPHPPAGPHTYTVTYAGTSAFSSASASTGVTITLPVSTSLSATATPNPAPLNDPVFCTVHVVAASGLAATGTVTFTDGATPLGQTPLLSGNQGIVAFSITNLSFGLHTIVVAFQPDPGFSASSGTCTVNVGGSASRTILTSSRNPALTTDTVTYTATVTNSVSTASGTAPTGSVTLSEGNTLLASAPLVAGSSGSSSAALPVSLPNPGTHILTATYIPATAASFTSSATLSETINSPPPITTVLSAAPNPATIGQTVVLSATVTSQAALPTPATLTFADGAALLGSAAVSSSGIASLSLNSLGVGSHQITAVLRGGADATTIRSTSNLVTVQVNGLATTLTLAAAPVAAFAATPVTLTASLAPASALPTGTTLSGSIVFLDGNLPLGVSSLSADGHATFTTSTLAPGPHLLSASFAGNAILSSATSATVTEAVAINPTTTALAVTSASVTAFAPVTLNAHVSSTTSATRINTLACPPACAPIAVSFFASSSTGSLTLGTVALDATGNASLTINPAVGTYSLSAVFSGSTIFAASASAAATLTATPSSTALTLTANPNPVYQHGKVALTAALTAPGIPASALTGTITFLEGATALGTTSLAAAQNFSYAPTSVGPHTLTAVFSGNPNLEGASASATVTVLPSDFVLSVKDPTLTIATTHHAPTTITINATGALADLIDLSCTNLPQYAYCTFAPATHDLTTANTSAGTLTLDTDALLNYARLDAPPGSSKGRDALTALLALSLPTTLLAGLTRLRRRTAPPSRRDRLPHLLAVLFLSVTALTLSGCSGLYPSHVAPGTYSVTITGHARTSGVEHSTTLSLVVTP